MFYAFQDYENVYLVSDLVTGGDLRYHICKNKKFSEEQTKFFVACCLIGLEYMHNNGVIHRDIKPSNLMLNVQSELRIIDFGIALGPNGIGSSIEGIAGSPSYMSPEQVQSASLSNRSDIYSLGAVMYELLTGVRPFRGANLAKLMHQIVYATPAPIHTLRDGVPEELESVVMTALSKDPEKRYASGQDLAAALTRVHQKFRAQADQVDQQEHFARLRRLPFFHEFSHAEITEILRASDWEVHATGTDLVREGEIEDRFYVTIDGALAVYKDDGLIGRLGAGDCFGEAACLSGARRQATIRAEGPVTVLRVSSTRLEQASPACQLHFNKVFLRSLVSRLQGAPKRD
jgi:serine/threonine protein kinase